MTTTDWIIDIVLVLIVVRQIREEELTARFVIIPAAIVAYVAHKYLQSFPGTTGNVALIATAVAAGTALGVLGGVITKVRTADGKAYVQAGWAAATLWVVSMSARLGFIIWITHPQGADVLGRFSMDHHITGAGVWPTALVLLALSEVAGRIGVIVLRGVLAISHTRRELVTV